MDLVQNLLIKIKKLSMELVHDRGSMDPVHKSGPWPRSKEGVHGPLVHVLSSSVIFGLSIRTDRTEGYTVCKECFTVRKSHLISGT